MGMHLGLGADGGFMRGVAGWGWSAWPIGRSGRGGFGGVETKTTARMVGLESERAIMLLTPDPYSEESILSSVCRNSHALENMTGWPNN